MTTVTGSKMLYRRFGRTELSMPVFTCGGMRYQQKWQDTDWVNISDESQANLDAVIRRSVELGINHIETARGYGTSEMQLGRILPQFPRESLIVQTKVGPSTNVKDFLTNFEKSLNYLNLDYVDLLSIHGINLPDHIHQSVRRGGCVDAAEKLVDQGLVRFIGFSTHGPEPVITQAIKTNRFDYVNLHWYYINQRNWPAIAAAHALDMGVFIISPSDKGGRLYSPPPRLVNLCHPLNPMVFNDLFCLSHSQVHTLSLGASRPSDFEDHLKALPLLDHADHHLQPILARLSEAWLEAVGSLTPTGFDNIPTHEHTPGHVNMPVILWLRNLVKAYDMVDYAKVRYNMLGNASHWFPGEKVSKAPHRQLWCCLEKHPHRERILSVLNEAHQILNDQPKQRLSRGG